MDRRRFLKVAAGAGAMAALQWVDGSIATAKTGKPAVEIANLKMPPLNTTLMGVLKGALDYYELATTVPTVFGVSGHAFVINIHKQLCPSGPYVWRRAKINPLIENLGLRMTDLGFFAALNSKQERAAVEEKLRAALDEGAACSLVNLDNQLITGYDDTGFFTAQPWGPKVGFPPARLSFGTWAELGEQFHINFYTLEKTTPAKRLPAVLESLDYVVSVHTQPAEHCHGEGYGVGPDAYRNWIKAVPDHGSSHGHWWNATVWAECRTMAAEYFAGIGAAFKHVAAPAEQLHKTYARIGTLLSQASDKEMQSQEKIALLEEARDKDAAAIEQVAQVAALLRADPNA